MSFNNPLSDPVKQQTQKENEKKQNENEADVDGVDGEKEDSLRSITNREGKGEKNKKEEKGG